MENLPKNCSDICNLFWYMWPGCKIAKTKYKNFLDISNRQFELDNFRSFLSQNINNLKVAPTTLGSSICKFMCLIYVSHPIYEQKLQFCKSLNRARVKYGLSKYYIQKINFLIHNFVNF